MEKYPIYKVDFNADIHSAHGLFGISLVNRPAIESDFIYMSEEQEDYKFSTDDKMEIVGAMMIPDKLIFRKREDKKFYLYFSKEDISAIVEKMSIDGFNNYFTVEHEYSVDGVYLKEIWIKEFDQDKSNEYGFSAPVGTAFCKLKVANEAVWQEVKNKGLKGLSIELKTDIKMEEKQEDSVILSEELFADNNMFKVPSGAKENAQKVLDWKEKYGSEVKGMTSVGWARARQLASQSEISLSTIKRMASFNRHRENAEVAPEYKNEPWKDSGYVAWLGWGGTSGIDWALKVSEANKDESTDDFALQIEMLSQTVERLSQAVEMFAAKAEPQLAVEQEVVVPVQEHEQPIAVENMAEVVEEAPVVVEAKEETELEFVIEESKSEQDIELAVEALLSEQTETVEMSSQEPKVLTRENSHFFSLLDKIYK